ncbi:response regulator transcription factor [Clostridium sp. HMP27]|uniref:response regulator n=1 Tax=Clostridium sp. HMP27 TaxID=1487921 RepID=UPI00052C661F|nr:response regulator transcription factor [Clostridium sp. HMP27]KGK85942.1 nitrate/nitrite response regulator protein narL [Clostridium sp. HMP27]
MKVVVIDDHPLVIKGLNTILALEKEIEVVGEAFDVKNGVEIIKSTRPDIALIDLRLGISSGLDIISRLEREKCNCKFVILTTSASEEDFKNCKEANVDGYILKNALPEEICYAIKIIYKGRKYYDPGILENIMSAENEIAIDCLTLRERDVLISLGKGLSNKEIAKKLYITEYTVKKHVSQVLNKLELSDRTQAAIYAVSSGIIKN